MNHIDTENSCKKEEMVIDHHNKDGIPPSALCFKCFKPLCDLQCKGQCMRYYHSCCVHVNINKQHNWKCSMCANKETERFVKLFRNVHDESKERHEPPGSGFSQLALLDTVVSHKKRDGFSLKTVKCSECDKRNYSQLVRCAICGSVFHRGCLPLNSIQLSHRLVICPSHYQNSNMDHLHTELKEQFDKLKGTPVGTGRGVHAIRGRGRGRSRGGVAGNRGGRGCKRLSHLILSDPTLNNTKPEEITCERCGKIHKYPGYIDRSYLPKHWYCEEDIWNKDQITCSTEICDKQQEHSKEDENAHIKMITPAIWGGESMKTNNKFVPANLNSVALINYIYFSKIAQRATHRTNYLGFVSSSYAFNHNVDKKQTEMINLASNIPIYKRAQALLTFFRTSSVLSLREIMNDQTFYSATFGNQKSLLVECIRYMLDNNLIVLVTNGNLTDDSKFVFNDNPSIKGSSVKDMRLHHMFNTV